MHAKPSHRIVVESAHAGQPRREGEVLEVVPDEDDREHYRVRWNDGHESIYFPSSDCRLVAAILDRRISARAAGSPERLRHGLPAGRNGEAGRHRDTTGPLAFRARLCERDLLDDARRRSCLPNLG
jgi:Domain of unknown function (DUF1918)